MRWGVTKLARPHGNNPMRGRNSFSWAQFEQLPRLVRDVLNFAPVDLGSQRARKR